MNYQIESHVEALSTTGISIGFYQQKRYLATKHTDTDGGFTVLFCITQKTGWFNIQSWHWHGFDWTDIIKLSIIECLRFSICQASCPAYGFKDPRGWTFLVKGQSLDPASLIFFVTFEVQGASIFTILTIHQFCYNRLFFLMMFIAYRPNWQSWFCRKRNAFASALFFSSHSAALFRHPLVHPFLWRLEANTVVSLAPNGFTGTRNRDLPSSYHHYQSRKPLSKPLSKSW